MVKINREVGMPYLVDYTCLLFIFLAIPSPSSLIPKQPTLDKLRMYDRPNFDQKLWELFKVEITDGIEVRGTRYRVGGNEGEREEGKDRKDDGGCLLSGIFSAITFYDISGYISDKDYIFSDSGIGNSNLSYFENVALQREIEKEIDLDGNK
ncbi:hypothetical protein X798_03592 [Onchocerca flexuosa]|uniref:Uncharacterized protein n=1 Tax=Onchocerca flexuosa TaxID=387005 RepID=A0A238BVS0_9BILA|nr:hypothetical protein X798_03592 [Onchocerca flexuosa]